MIRDAGAESFSHIWSKRVPRRHQRGARRTGSAASLAVLADPTTVSVAERELLTARVIGLCSPACVEILSGWAKIHILIMVLRQVS